MFVFWKRRWEIFLYNDAQTKTEDLRKLSSLILLLSIYRFQTKSAAIKSKRRFTFMVVIAMLFFIVKKPLLRY
jgi:ABC-type arginine transport system permease subunit